MCFQGCVNEYISGECRLSEDEMIAYHAQIEESEPVDGCPTPLALDFACTCRKIGEFERMPNLDCPLHGNNPQSQ